MQTLNIFPELGILSWIVISVFVVFNLFFLLWMHRNWKGSNKKESSIPQKEKQYNDFIEITGYPIEKEKFIYLNSEVIAALFNIFCKGQLTTEDFSHILLNWARYDNVSNDFEKIPKDIYDLYFIHTIVKEHIDNNMIFTSDKFFQVFFGFGDYYQQFLNENKK